MSRSNLLRQIRECRREVAKLRRLYPHAMRWATLTFQRKQS
jgi:hypothetical protein